MQLVYELDQDGILVCGPRLGGKLKLVCRLELGDKLGGFVDWSSMKIEIKKIEKNRNIQIGQLNYQILLSKSKEWIPVDSNGFEWYFWVWCSKRIVLTSWFRLCGPFDSNTFLENFGPLWSSFDVKLVGVTPF